MLGLRPWLALLRRTFAFFLLVRFDMASNVSEQRTVSLAKGWVGGFPTHVFEFTVTAAFAGGVRVGRWVDRQCHIEFGG